MKIQTCIVCGKTFEAPTAKRKICSAECLRLRKTQNETARREGIRTGRRPPRLVKYYANKELQEERAARIEKRKSYLAKRDRAWKKQGAANVPRSVSVRDGFMVETRGRCGGSVGVNHTWQHFGKFR